MTWNSRSNSWDFHWRNWSCNTNNGAPTFFNTRSRNFSAIDLYLSSSSVAPKLTWEVLDVTYYSDYFPITLTTDTQKKADWEKLVKVISIPNLPDYPEETVCIFMHPLTEPAIQSIPKSSRTVLSRTLPDGIKTFQMISVKRRNFSTDSKNT